MHQKLALLLLSMTLLARISAQDTTPPTKEALNSKALKEDFYSLDKNDDGFVDAHELRISLPGVFEDDITAFFDKYDADRDGVLTLEEYLTISQQ